MRPDGDRPTARDRPPEEAAEDTSFARGLRVLLTIADRGEVRADELSVLLDTPVSTIYRYLRTLSTFGFVDRQGPGYRLGPRLIIGSGTNVTAEELIRTSGPVLDLLADETGETAVIVRRIGLSAVCLHEVPSKHPLRVTIPPDTALPLHQGALGKALLAFAPDDILDEALARRAATIAPASIPNGSAPRSPTSSRRGSPARPARHVRERGDRGSHIPRRRHRRGHRGRGAGVTLRPRVAHACRPPPARRRELDRGRAGHRTIVPGLPSSRNSPIS